MSKTVLKWANLLKQSKRSPVSRSRIAFVDAGYTGDAPAEAAKARGIQLEVVKLEDGQARFCLVASAMGDGALVCLDHTLSAVGARL